MENTKNHGSQGHNQTSGAETETTEKKNMPGQQQENRMQKDGTGNQPGSSGMKNDEATKGKNRNENHGGNAGSTGNRSSNPSR
jgi:hypothetical protein